MWVLHLCFYFYVFGRKGGRFSTRCGSKAPIRKSSSKSHNKDKDENVPIDPLLLTSTIPRALEKKKKKPLIAFHLMFFLLGVVERCTQMFIKIDLLELFEDILVLELFTQLDLVVCVMIIHLFYSNIIKHDMN